MKVIIDLEQLINEIRQVVKEELAIFKQSLPSSHPEKPISQAELSRYLNVSVQTLIRWRKKGLIPFIEGGGAIRYDKAKVIKALENK